MRSLLCFCMSLALALSAAAQETCDQLLNAALDQVDTACQNTHRNELCYGHSQVTVRTHNPAVDFSRVGDVLSIAEVSAIHTSPFSAPDEWGLALLRLQATLPDTLPSQNVTVLMMGAVTIEENPMQAIVFKSGIGRDRCAGLPPDGLLIQTPHGVGTVYLTVNEVRVELGSTAYFQTTDEFMTVSVLEGWAILRAFDAAQIVPAGMAARVPIDDDGRASGPPQAPQPYDPDTAATLSPLTETAPSAEATPTDAPIVADGSYTVRWSTLIDCPAAVFEFPETWITTLNDDGSVTTWGRTWFPAGEGRYTYADEFGESGMITFSSPTRFNGWWSYALEYPEPCPATYGVTAEWAGP